MQLIYGNSYCTLKYNIENIRNVIIKYKGSITIKHHHMEFIKRIDKNRARFFNFGKKSLLIQKLNEIHIGYNEDTIGEIELFRWIGNFRITSAKVNGKSVPVTVTNVDYWNLINSKWDSAGKPELYKGTYRFGRTPRRRKRRSRGISRRLSTKTATRTVTRSSGGGY